MNTTPQLRAKDVPITMAGGSGTISIEELNAHITPAWLTTALAQRYSEIEVLSSSIIKVVVGYSVKIWVKMAFNAAGIRARLPDVMIVKGGFNQKDPGMQFGNWLEMLVYRDLRSLYPINSPHCFYAGEGPGELPSAIIIEDLNARRVRFCNALSPLTYGEAARFLDALARFHSLSWNDPTIRDESTALGQKLALLQKAMYGYKQTMSAVDQWQHYMALPRGVTIPRRLQNRELFMVAYDKMLAFNATQPHVVLHGDEHLNNLYIEEDGTPGFFDLQFCCGAWSQGVAYFLGCSLDICDRREWEQSLLTYYLSRLADYGVKAPSYEEAWKAYCIALFFGFSIWPINGTEFQTEASNTANTVRFATAIIDNDTLGLLGIAID